MPELPGALRLHSEYRDYVWGGRERLRPGQLTAEAWVVYENDRIDGGPLAGRTLGEVAAEQGAALLGRRAVTRTGSRFPLLIKLLDCEQWLSLQVHPNDEQAVRLAGKGHFGKTEAWHILAADPGATLIAGIRPGTTQAALAAAIRDGRVIDLAEPLAVNPGDTVVMRAGTLHALGPGLFVYEVQQTSDLTYRVYDWGRPQTAARGLHLDQSIAVTDPAALASATPAPGLGDGECGVLCHTEYFTLTMLHSQGRACDLDTAGETFHALTVIDGTAQLIIGGMEVGALGEYASVVIPAATGAYRLEPAPAFRALKASV
ncbi:MAG: class I mannose-6-phosphate isomerase [Anaerolineae bacterium]|nr:class I mannose-6-phosphate isomerase [Anaerolineae bacterium]